MSLDYSKKLLSDFRAALEELKSALGKKNDDKVYKAGCIQFFEFCFELAWKTVKAFLDYQGIIVNSPRASLKEAYKQGWVSDEGIWLEMLDSRNQMSHNYSERDALIVYERLPLYLDHFKELIDKLEKVS